jgi:hypothetical protein
MLRALFRRKPKTPTRRTNNGVRQGPSPRRNNVRKGVLNRANNRALRGLRGIVTAKSGGHRWATRARRAINNRGRPTVYSPRRNIVMKKYVPGMWN